MREDKKKLLSQIQTEATSSATAAGYTGSAADELIADRRAEAAWERAEEAKFTLPSAPDLFDRL